jgi:hypothetical protein
MLLHSFGRDFLPWSDYSKAIRAELERQSHGAIEISDHSLMSARGDDDSDRPFIEYLRTYYAKKAPDLIVSIGAPAAVFVQHYRQELFAGSPMLLTAVEQRRVDSSLLAATDTVVAVNGDLIAFMEDLLRLLPDTRTVAYVNGSSPSERFWRQEITRVLKPYENRISLVWWSELSFENMLAQAATLPPHSAIVWQLLNVDGAGMSHEGDAALNRMRAAANAPIFTYQGAYFGDRIVGGPMYSVEEVSQRAACGCCRGRTRRASRSSRSDSHDRGTTGERCSAGASARAACRRAARSISVNRPCGSNTAGRYSASWQRCCCRRP